MASDKTHPYDRLLGEFVLELWLLADPSEAGIARRAVANERPAHEHGSPAAEILDPERARSRFAPPQLPGEPYHFLPHRFFGPGAEHRRPALVLLYGVFLAGS